MIHTAFMRLLLQLFGRHGGESEGQTMPVEIVAGPDAQRRARILLRRDMLYQLEIERAWTRTEEGGSNVFAYWERVERVTSLFATLGEARNAAFARLSAMSDS